MLHLLLVSINYLIIIKSPRERNGDGLKYKKSVKLDLNYYIIYI